MAKRTDNQEITMCENGVPAGRGNNMPTLTIPEFETAF